MLRKLGSQDFFQDGYFLTSPARIFSGLVGMLGSWVELSSKLNGMRGEVVEDVKLGRVELDWHRFNLAGRRTIHRSYRAWCVLDSAQGNGEPNGLGLLLARHVSDPRRPARPAGRQRLAGDDVAPARRSRP